MHPNSKNIVARSVDQEFRYNHRHGLRPGAAGSEEGRRQDRLGRRRVRQGPFPVPDNTPIEGCPVNYKGLTLDEVQREDEGDIDRHAMIVDPTKRMLYEFYQMRKTDRGGSRRARRSST